MKRSHLLLPGATGIIGGAALTGERARSLRTSAPGRPRRAWLTTLAVATGVTCTVGAPAAMAASIAGVTPLAGNLISIGHTSLTIQTRRSQATISTAATTSYYQVAPATARSLTVGETVAVSAGVSASTAAAVVMVPQGRNLTVFVLRSGSLGSGGSITGGGDDGGGADGGGGRGASREVTGRITALSSGSITILPIGGAKTTMTLNASTARYRVTPITRSQLRTGSYVATRAGLGTGSAASDVVEASPGTTISIGASIGGQSSGE